MVLNRRPLTRLFSSDFDSNFSVSDFLDEKFLEPADPPLISEVMVVPITRRPLFPGILSPVSVPNPQILNQLVSHQFDNDYYVGVFLQKSPDVIVDGPIHIDNIYDCGSFAKVHKIESSTKGGGYGLMLAHRRLIITGVVQEEPVLTVNVFHKIDEKSDSNEKEIKAYTMEIMSTLKDILNLNPLFKDQLEIFVHQADLSNPAEFIDLAAALSTTESADLQEILKEFDLIRRASKVLLLLKKDLELSKMQYDIGKQVEEKMSSHHRRILLEEQYKAIKKELGLEKDDKSALIQKYMDRLKEKVLPPEVQRVITEEMEKLSGLEHASQEFNVTRNYLDWLTSMPWGVFDIENSDVNQASEVLNQDHYGMDDVKNRILEFIAVGKRLGKNSHGKILCFIGPPGVGKTSIGSSIARCLNRKFYRFSTGGMTDVAEIKGHRRTYVGAMPGKIVQCLKSVGTQNPVILIDEIDKIGKGYQGDPASALLELLDPKQNKAFLDHYLDIPTDVSNVLFICTANIDDTIPSPLRDRMEFIRLSGYIHNEKMEIARNYLIPSISMECGVTNDEVFIDDSALNTLIRWYCREAGVRNLGKHIERIFRKAALNLVREDDESRHKKIIVSDSNLDEFVGKAIFTSDRLYEQTGVGVVMGLAWSSLGGSTLYIESTKALSESLKLKHTGRLGETMIESTDIAYTYAKNYLKDHFPDNDFFAKSGVHLHVPEGGVSKDGPSAGIAMVTSLLSLALDKPVYRNIAMTGEISLTGKVLPIGGVKEKVIAAKRSNVAEIVLPIGNLRDVDELPNIIKDNLQFFYVDYYHDVFDLALK